jgi:hypothetical protein
LFFGSVLGVSGMRLFNSIPIPSGQQNVVPTNSRASSEVLLSLPDPSKPG